MTFGNLKIDRIVNKKVIHNSAIIIICFKMALKTSSKLKSIFIFTMTLYVMILYRNRNPCIAELTPYTTAARKCVKTPLNNTCGLVFCYQNCSDLLWEKIVLVIEKNFQNSWQNAREFAKILRSIEQFIQTVKGQNHFW